MPTFLLLTYMSSTAAQLKDEGNKLFSQKKFSGAILKYTAAIAADENSAVPVREPSGVLSEYKRVGDSLTRRMRAGIN